MQGRTTSRQHPVYFLDCVSGAGIAAVRADRLAEDAAFYVPDLLSAEGFEPDPAHWDAAEAHARKLHKAGRHIDDALNLTRVLRGAVREDGDSRAMQVDTVLRIAEKKLDRARRQIDRHDASHMNLFMAYAELKDHSGGG